MLKFPGREALLLAIGAAALCGCASMPGAARKPALSTEAREPLSSPLSLARLSERHGQHEYAAQLYRAIMKNEPKNQVAHHRLGVLEGRMGHFDLAQEHFDKAAELGADSSEYWNDRGYCLYLQDRLEEAESALRAAVSRDPANKEAHNNLGLVLGEQGKFEDSLVAFKTASDEAEAHANLAYVKAQGGDYAGAEQEYHRALRMNADLRPAAEALLQLPQNRNTVPAVSQSYLPPRAPERAAAPVVQQASFNSPEQEPASGPNPPAVAAGAHGAGLAPWQQPSWSPPTTK